MSALYVESSALLAWVFGEAQSQDVRRAIDDASEVVTSALTLLEAERALVRFHLQSRSKEAELRRALVAVRRVVAGWTTMEISRAVRQRAGQPFPVEPLRALDAVHLATALEFVAAFPTLKVLSFDRRIIENLEALGLG